MRAVNWGNLALPDDPISYAIAYCIIFLDACECSVPGAAVCLLLEAIQQPRLQVQVSIRIYAGTVRVQADSRDHTSQS